MFSPQQVQKRKGKKNRLVMFLIKDQIMKKMSRKTSINRNQDFTVTVILGTKKVTDRMPPILDL